MRITAGTRKVEITTHGDLKAATVTEVEMLLDLAVILIPLALARSIDSALNRCWRDKLSLLHLFLRHLTVDKFYESEPVISAKPVEAYSMKPIDRLLVRSAVSHEMLCDHILRQVG
ncbi:hypothetical protein SAY87_019695 [Trapa incisa]|uniref:Uncharacterized protein n=1 Tax=Trapa incisa TaxID=236973 RepID=A0AAN7K2P2_9MYRT|nr:hypothetical protein SAY87_019695 [Trapa incisa]